MKPIVIKDVLDQETRGRLLSDCDRLWRRKEIEYEATYGRYIAQDKRLWMYLERLLPLAREIFNSETLLPSYACWSLYYKASSNLPKHKDNNACTYTIDYCVRQYEPWPLFVEDDEFILRENEGLAFLGEDQEHWRPDFPQGNVVEMVFFHFVEPDHWYFTN